MGGDLAYRMQVTNGLLGMTYSALQGTFVALNVLAQFGHPDASAQKQEQTKQSLDFVRTGLDDLMAGRPWFDRYDGNELPANPNRAYTLFDSTRMETAATSVALFKVHALPRWVEHPREVQVLLAWLCAQAYCREHYVSGQVRFHTVIGNELEADRWRQGLLSCQQERTQAEAFLAVYQEGSRVDSRYFFQLRDTTVLLPYAYRMRVQDMNSVFGYFVGEHTWQTAEIDEAAAARWQQAGMDVSQAVSWHAYRIEPEEVTAWAAVGLARPVDVANWKYRRFTPETAAPWLDAGFSATDAYISVLNRQTPAQARSERPS